MGLVALEAIGCKIPVIGFENASGAIKYISQGFGSVVPYLNIAAMSGELHKYLSKTISIRSDGDVFLSQEHSVEKSRDSFYQEFRNALKTETQNPGRTVLILSAVPPPLFGSRVEGGGLRAWGLARSIKRMLPDHAVTFCYFHPSPASGNKISQGYYEDIFVTECAPNKLSDIVRNFSTVLMSYCMGGHSKEILAALASDQQLILDCYVPIYVEICARRSNQVQIEYDGLMSEIPTFNLALKRGDFFLCANQAQYDFYRGVLAALGRINPKTYGDMGLRIVPYGIDSDEPIAREQPIKKLLGHEYPKSWKLLWFGAVYPWFNIDILVNAIQLLNEKHPTQMIMVGARNPFNGHPDFIKKSNHVEALVSSPGVSHLIHMQEWVPYEERANWYLDCDLIITLNEPGMENGLSWRTRVADYVWAGMPIASNGGDPLTEDLIARGAAGRLDISSTEKLSESIYKLLADEVGLKKMKEQMQAFRPNLYWDKVIKPLGEIIQNHSVAPDRVS